MCGGGTILLQDLPPFIMCNGNPAKPFGVHVEGLKRRQFSAESIAALRRAYKIVYRENLPLAEARIALDALIAAEPHESAAPLRAFAEFLANPGRGLLR
jgi:UDP-N-acetylglucosamine acyltransferase